MWGGEKWPSNSKSLELLFQVFKVPFLGKFFKKRILVGLKIPLDTSIIKGFYCSAPNIEVGEHTGLGNSFILAIGKVKIGRNTSLSYNNVILTSTHNFKDFSEVIAKPVTIGNNVWITSNCILLPGVTIGDNTVIGAGSVVTHDIPSGVFAAGNPCKVIKKINFNK